MYSLILISNVAWEDNRNERKCQNIEKKTTERVIIEVCPKYGDSRHVQNPLLHPILERTLREDPCSSIGPRTSTKTFSEKVDLHCIRYLRDFGYSNIVIYVIYYPYSFFKTLLSHLLPQLF